MGGSQLSWADWKMRKEEGGKNLDMEDFIFIFDEKNIKNIKISKTSSPYFQNMGEMIKIDVFQKRDCISIKCSIS